MKQDLDALMERRDLDAIWVTGPGRHNPPMVYLTGGSFLTGADLIQKRGGQPVLFHHTMERDEAAKTGLQTRDLGSFQFDTLLKESGGDYQQATVRLYQKILTSLELTAGKVAVYGISDAGRAATLFSGLEEVLPELTICGEINDSLLMEAMATKDEAEVERIRGMGKIATAVIGKVADFLSSHRVQHETLVLPDGSPLTIGEVKRRIDLWLAELGAENPEGTIFAIGKQAAVPHNSGDPASPLRLGQTIVFDLFPCEAGGGYFYDITRTWCLGYAPDEAYQLYEDVRQVHDQMIRELQVGSLSAGYQKRACELFEAAGHPTIQSDPQTQSGYVHGLGHGVGLYIHERPHFTKQATDRDRLLPGTVFTIEPGLYYPEKGLGVRLEDTLWMRPDGKAEILAEYPLDLVLPVQKE